MRPSSWILLVLLLVPLATQANPSAEAIQAADDALLGPVQELMDELPEGVDRKPAEQALAAHAYRSALLALSEQAAITQGEAAWEAAQTEESPAQGFVNNLTYTFNLASEAMVATAQRIQTETALPLTAERADHLVLAANLLVEAEAERQSALSYLSAQQTGDNFGHPIFRYTLARPVVGAQLLTGAVNLVLDGLPEPQGKPVVDLAKLSTLIQQRGGTPTSPIPAGGPIHLLARHVRAYMLELPNATYAEVSAALADTGGMHEDIDAMELDGAFAATAELDIAYWLGRFAAEPDSPVNGPMLRTLNATLAGVVYEAALLEASASHEARAFEMGPWTWGALGVGAAAVVAGLSWKAVRRRES